MRFENGMVELHIKLSVRMELSSESDNLGAVVEETPGDEGFVFEA